MQGKALVVNPAVIHPSATPTIVVGRASGLKGFRERQVTFGRPCEGNG